MNNQFALGHLIDGQWKVIRILPRIISSYDRYLVQNQNKDIIATCDVESQDPFFLLKYDAWITKELSELGLFRIPKFISYGQNSIGRYNYLCTKTVGPNLQELRNALPPAAENRFSLPTCLHVGLEMLFALQEFHEAGYLHRIIKPPTFCLDNSAPRSLMLQIIRGLSRRWRKFDGSNTAFPLRSDVPFFGNLKYASVRSLRKKDKSRIDDLWSLFYVLVDLTMGRLPWPANLPGNISEQLMSFANIKESINDAPSEWLSSTPKEFMEILYYLKSSPPEIDPDYTHLIILLKNAMYEALLETGDELKLDWESGGRYYNELYPIVISHQ